MAILAVAIVVLGGSGIVLTGAAFVINGAGPVNVRFLGIGAGALMLAAISTIILGVIWDNVKKTLAAAADKADDPIQWLGQTVREFGNNLLGRATS